MFSTTGTDEVSRQVDEWLDGRRARFAGLIAIALASVTAVEARWQEWCSRFDDAYRDVQTMFHIRHVWKNLIAMLEQNPALGDTAVVKSWIIRTYVDTQCSTIRRLNDDNRQTASLRQCFRWLIKNPMIAARSRFEQLVRDRAADRNDVDERFLRDRGFRGYDDFADASGDFLRVRGVEDDLAKLGTLTERVKAYTDKRVAHIEHGVDLSALGLTFGDLDEAIDAVGVLAGKYWRLRHPGDHLWHITPLVPPSWLTAFMHPWWTSDFKRIEEDTLG